MATLPALPVGLPPVSDARLPEVYERAKGALTTCANVDECQDWADKFEALASYAKQAGDQSLREMADRIQARAIKRCGDLLKRIEANQGGRPPKETRTAAGTSFTRTQAASDAGLSKRQKDTALRVANIPDQEFEELIESDNPPTVTALAELGKNTTNISKKRVWAAQETKHFVREVLRLVRSYEKAHGPIESLLVSRSKGVPVAVEILHAADQEIA